jgi:hypothetical protein
VLKRQQQFSTIETRSFLIETLLPLQMMEKLSTIYKAERQALLDGTENEKRKGVLREYEIELLFRLEAELERDDEGIVHPC